MVPQNAPPQTRPARSVVRRLFPKENESFLASNGLLWSGEMRDECAHALLIVGPSGRRYVNRENTVATARASLTITSATWFGNRPGTHWNRAAAACHPRRRADARLPDPSRSCLGQEISSDDVGVLAFVIPNASLGEKEDLPRRRCRKGVRTPSEGKLILGGRSGDKGFRVELKRSNDE